MIAVAEALNRIVAGFSPNGTEIIPISQALGRVVAEDVHASLTQPPVSVSAMDGYAARYQDVRNAPITLVCVGEAPAGHAFPGVVQAGQCVRIYTGGPVPSGANCIIIQENTEADGTLIKVMEPGEPGGYIRGTGMDFRKGEVGLTSGTRLGPRHLALAAAMNIGWVSVYRRPRIAVLATGDELVRPGQQPSENQIICSNTSGLMALIESYGGKAVDLGIAPDNEDSLRKLAIGARGCDLLITTGGISIGQYDLVRQALGDLGLELDFWKIAMKPGKPLAFGKLGDTPMLGLPGNPVSAMVCGLLFVRPVIAALMGQDWQRYHRTEKAVLGAPLKPNNHRQDYLRATLGSDPNGRFVATPFDRQDSAMLSLLARADCLIVRSPQAPAAKVGEMVDILRFPFDPGVF